MFNLMHLCYHFLVVGDESDWRKCDSLARILVTCPQQSTSASCYYTQVCPQVNTTAQQNSKGAGKL